MNKIGLIIGREFNIRVQKRSFIVTTILMPLLMVVMMVAPTLIAMYKTTPDEQKIIVIVDKSHKKIGVEITDFEEVVFKQSNCDYPQVVTENPEAYAYLIIGEKVMQNPNNVQLYSRQNSTIDLQNGINKQISEILSQHKIEETNIHGLNEIIEKVRVKSSLSAFGIEVGKNTEIKQQAQSPYVAIGVGYISGFVIFMFIFLYGMMVMQGVVEEKSNRIVEVIISSARPLELMLGKILGIGSVALVQFLIWGIIASVLLIVVLPIMAVAGIGAEMGVDVGSMSRDLSAVSAGIPAQLVGVLEMLTDPLFVLRVLGGFLVYFVGGYLLYAGMFAAVGSAVENVADTQQLQLPVIAPLIIAMMMMLNTMNNPYSELAFWGSMIPFTSPVIMMVRVAYGVSWWEFALSTTLLYGTSMGITVLAAKIYRTGIFMYGKKPSFVEMIRWIRRS